ncbi:ATP-binding protein [Streptomyces sp. NPDC006879]|uniref:ATP-binding protein n=1 Tax=Streptomyces sp. NPDC006879 TaxID=3364767 RepID=UPI0036858E7B
MTTSPSPQLPYRHVLTVPAVGAAVRIARETTELILVECGIGLRHPSVGPALLIVAELVTNAVRHAAAVSPVITISYSHGPGVLSVDVHDLDPFLPPLHGAASGAPGSGLAIVAELTGELGGTAAVRPHADGRGKSIEVTIPL